MGEGQNPARDAGHGRMMGRIRGGEIQRMVIARQELGLR